MKKTKKMLSILLCILMTVGIFCSTPIIANAGNIAVEDSGASLAAIRFNNTTIKLGIGETYISIIPNVSNSNSSIQMGYARCKVVVKKAPTYVTLSKSSLTLGVGETFSIYKTITNFTLVFKLDYILFHF